MCCKLTLVYVGLFPNPFNPFYHKSTKWCAENLWGKNSLETGAAKCLKFTFHLMVLLLLPQVEIAENIQASPRATGSGMGKHQEITLNRTMPEQF